RQALAWEVLVGDAPTITEKYGGLNNASAYIGMMPRRRLGIVILGNRGNQYPNEARPRILLELAAFRPLPAWERGAGAPRSSGRWRPVVSAHAQLAHRQLVHFERLKTRLLDRYAADGEPADRQRADGNGSERSRADRKRDHAGGGNGFGSANDSTRHRGLRQAAGFRRRRGGSTPGRRPHIGRLAGARREPPPGEGAIPICRRCGEQVFSWRVDIGLGRGTA